MHKIRIAFAALGVLCALSAAGCGKKDEEYGSKAEDWKKSSPPPNYRGPGQPGGPDAKPAGSAR